MGKIRGFIYCYRDFCVWPGKSPDCYLLMIRFSVTVGSWLTEQTSSMDLWKAQGMSVGVRHSLNPSSSVPYDLEQMAYLVLILLP